ncbi:hypothetical protein CsSME_00003273 [Camellia sinensis var. sinensis]
MRVDFSSFSLSPRIDFYGQPDFGKPIRVRKSSSQCNSIPESTLISRENKVWASHLGCKGWLLFPGESIARIIVTQKQLDHSIFAT